MNEEFEGYVLLDDTEIIKILDDMPYLQMLSVYTWLQNRIKMNYIKELMIDHDLTYEEAVEYMCDIADRLKDEAKYNENTNN